MNSFPRIHSDAELPSPEKFTRPPVTERVAQFWFEISQEEFDHSIPSWLDDLLDGGAFHKRQVTEQWEFGVEIRPGNPPRPKATLTQIPKLTRTQGVPLTLEIYPPQGDQSASLKISQPRSEEHQTRFNGFRDECAKWLASLLDQLGVSGVKRLALTYRNEFSRQRYPAYWDSDLTVRLGSLLKILQTMPNPESASYEGNFLIDFTRRLAGHEDRSLRVRLTPEFPNKKQLVWNAHFTYSSWDPILAKGGIEETMNELAGGHSYIYEEFCVQFSLEALEMFAK